MDDAYKYSLLETLLQKTYTLPSWVAFGGSASNVTYEVGGYAKPVEISCPNKTCRKPNDSGDTKCWMCECSLTQ
jgi:hypothetical protein